MVHSVEIAYMDPLNKQISGLLSQTTGVKTRMKHLIAFFVLILIAGSCSVAAAQQTYTSDQAGYTLELPSSVWRAISEPDAAHEHAEFVNGDRLDGYLQIRK